MKTKLSRTRKIYRVRHMEYMLYLAKRAQRNGMGDPEKMQFHVDNYTMLLQFEKDSNSS